MSISKVKPYQVRKGTVRKIGLSENQTLLLKKAMRSKQKMIQG